MTRRVLLSLLSVAILYTTANAGGAVALGTVPLLAKSGDALWCCATNQGVNDITLTGVNIFDINGTILGITPHIETLPLPPVTLAPRQSRCFVHENTGGSAFFKCELYGEGPVVTKTLAGSFMIGVISGDPNRVHAVVEAHRIPGTTAFVPSLKPCGDTYPTCNGSCPFGSGFCGASASGFCFCGIP